MAVAETLKEQKEVFLKIFHNHEAGLNGFRNHPYHQFRRLALGKMESLDFPTRRDEDWKYTSLRPILNQEYKLGGWLPVEGSKIGNFLLKDQDTYLLVFVNGIFQADLSSFSDLESGIRIEKTSEAFGKVEDAEFLLHEALNASRNAILPLNLALSQGSFFLKVDKNTSVKKPVHVLHLVGGEAENQLINPNLLIQLEQGSSLTLVESYHTLGQADQSFINSVGFFNLGINAVFNHYKIQDGGENQNFVTNQTVQQAKDSTYNSFVLDIGGNLVRNNISTILGGTNTTTHLFGAYLPDEDQHVDNQTFIDHAHPHCFSNELYKGVIGKNGRGVFNGQVMVRQDAQKTNAFQQNSNLLLDDSSVMDSKPQLEIYADDVKCSHGATIGQLDDASIFYLKSRGLSEASARSLLQYAFLGEVINHFELPSVKKMAEELILEKLSSH